MAWNLNEKVAIVTGGTKGIGLAIAESLLEAGAAVIICGRSQSGIDRALAELRTKGHSKVSGQRCDVSKPEDVVALFTQVESEHNRLDILVNNAGVGIFRPVAELTFEDWRSTIETNLSGTFYCSHQAVPLMKRGGSGSIINISSLAGRNPLAGGSAYNASKFGLNGFSEALMLDHRNDGIRVSYVMPGSVDTQFSRSSASAPWKIAPTDIADIVMSILRMPARTLISRVEVRPAQPPT